MKIDVKVLIGKQIQMANLNVKDQWISFESNTYNIVKDGKFPFMVLKEIRRELEILDALLLINASRFDVFPSGMTAEGHMAYIQILGKPTKKEDLVNIFEETDLLDRIGTVEDQDKYHKEWIKTLRG